jgi:hypothetical protein
MLWHGRRRLIALGATVVIAVFIGLASAARLSFSSQTQRSTWSSYEFESEFGTIRCAITMEGSLHARTFAKVREALIGYVTRVRVQRPCTGGTAWAHSGETNEVLGGTVSNTLPWHIVYQGFEGTLPNITGIQVEVLNSGFLLRFPIAGLCEYTTGALARLRLIWVRDGMGNVIEHDVIIIGKRSSSGGLCPTINYGARGPMTVLNSTTRVTVTLI